MEATRRWVIEHSFAWPPVLTFWRRRLRLLDWLESNVDVVEVLDEQDVFGIACGDDAARLVVHRDGMQISALRPEVDIDFVRSAAQGVLELIEPRGVMHMHTVGRWAAPLDTDLLTGCASLADRVAGDLPAGFHASDVALLLDVAAGPATMQVEYGVVDESQLSDRLTGTTRGRGSLSPDLVLPTTEPMPSCSLFAQILWSHPAHAPIRTVEDLYQVCADATQASSDLLNALAITMKDGVTQS